MLQWMHGMSGSSSAGPILCWVTSNFLRVHVSEDKVCWNDSCWFVGRVLGVVTMS